MKFLSVRSLRKPPGFWISKSYAFSLVEVALAMGMLSFVAASVMGLMGVGITTTRATIDTSVSAQILQELSGKIFLTPYSGLSAEYSAGIFHYTEDGRLQEAPDGSPEKTPDNNTIYTLNTSITDAVYPVDAVLDATKSLQVVKVAVKKSHGNVPIGHCNVLVPNSGN